MSLDSRRIGPADRDRHAAFFALVAAIFPGAGASTWPLWRDRGGWTDQYEVFALTDGDHLAGTIGRSRMTLVVDGAPRPGWQLGAVATHPDYRGQGIARRLMQQVLAAPDAADEPVLLFANPSVLDFYPRFGFRPIPLQAARAGAAVTPAGPPAPRCDPADPAQRARLAALCATAIPLPGRLAARDYGWLAQWHLSCGPARAFWLAAQQALVATTTEQGRLVVQDIFAPRRFDLRAALPSLIAEPVSDVEFRFDPQPWWPAPCAPCPPPADTTLFLRGAPGLSGPLGFPGLAHT